MIAYGPQTTEDFWARSIVDARNWTRNGLGLR
jgi:hypothetical protein